MFKVYTDDPSGTAVDLVTAPLRAASIRFVVVNDAAAMLRAAQGVVRPGAAVAVSPDGAVLRDVFQVAAWVQAKGLVPL